ncbi:MAG: hypothetical protein AAB870_03785, partial [Patescibacteria group bacterium]
MFAVKKRVRALFVNPKEKLSLFLEDLKPLKQTLMKAVATADPLADIVEFFNETSKWQDRGLEDVIKEFEAVNYGQFNGVLKYLQELEAYFTATGRQSCGWNRTQVGEQVTE